MRQNDLTPLERQLAACHPAAAGLDADAMLFAAGQAAATKAARQRWIWPATTCSFAVLSLALSAALVGERSERLALAARLGRQATETVKQSTAPIPDYSPPAADSYIAVRRLIEDEPEEAIVRSDPKSPLLLPPEDRPVLRAWSTDLEP